MGVAGQCRTNPWPAYQTEPWCWNAYDGQRQLTARRNTDAGLAFLRHSGIYIWFFNIILQEYHHQQLSMDVQGVLLSTSCSLDVHWVSLSPRKTTSFFNCRNVGLSGIQSVRYWNEQKFRCRKQSGSEIRGPSPVPEWSGTGLRYRMPECRCPAMRMGCG